jgi:hypothetical protein
MKSRRIPAVVAVALVAVVSVAAIAQDAKPKAVAHDLAGREQCLMCHTAGAMEAVPDVPATHAERPNEVCMWCHAADSPMMTVTPKSTPHDLAGRDQCMMCHKAGAMEAIPDAPANHEERDVKYCVMCHPAAG